MCQILLYLLHAAQAQAIYGNLMARGIPAVLLSGLNFWEKVEVKLALACAKLVASKGGHRQAAERLVGYFKGLSKGLACTCGSI